ncbi:hypothetical protein Pcinc_010397 [Petrolisthes cinctipes]|uniref:Parvovirus non-structural protein 1 helicase domain-containing protein n=1 Tax=Petrolisthes cinctipes TaxID=88211 RepID=A0AAE1KUK1_PETCI|nr:hypothetical protein Pcinc_010397 [Petrolisthes cinctipes]
MDSQKSTDGLGLNPKRLTEEVKPHSHRPEGPIQQMFPLQEDPTSRDGQRSISVTLGASVVMVVAKSAVDLRKHLSTAPTSKFLPSGDSKSQQPSTKTKTISCIQESGGEQEGDLKKDVLQTVVFLQRESIPDQDLFIRGGISESLRPPVATSTPFSSVGSNMDPDIDEWDIASVGSPEPYVVPNLAVEDLIGHERLGSPEPPEDQGPRVLETPPLVEVTPERLFSPTPENVREHILSDITNTFFTRRWSENAQPLTVYDIPPWASDSQFEYWSAVFDGQSSAMAGQRANEGGMADDSQRPVEEDIPLEVLHHDERAQLDRPPAEVHGDTTQSSAGHSDRQQPRTPGEAKPSNQNPQTPESDHNYHHVRKRILQEDEGQVSEVDSQCIRYAPKKIPRKGPSTPEPPAPSSGRSNMGLSPKGGHIIARKHPLTPTRRHPDEDAELIPDAEYPTPPGTPTADRRFQSASNIPSTSRDKTESSLHHDSGASSEEKENRDSDGPRRPRRASKFWYTFIIHYPEDILENLERKFERRITKYARPNYCFAIHGGKDGRGHIHVLYEAWPANSKRTRARIIADLPQTNSSGTESELTNTKISYQKNFLLYILRKGLSTFKVISQGVQSAIDCINCMKSSIDAVDATEKCIQYVNEKRMAKKQNKPTPLDMDDEEDGNVTVYSKMHRVIQPYIAKHKPKNMTELMNMMDFPTQDLLLKSYGTNYKRFASAMIELYNVAEVNKQREIPFLRKIEREININEYRKRDYKPIQNWLNMLFESNNIDPIDFMAHFILIADKKINKINSFILRGNVNTGKSLIINALTKILRLSNLNRQGEASQFYFQNLITSPAVVIEEPLITPLTVNTMKLLMGGENLATDKKNDQTHIVKRIPCFFTTTTALAIDCNGVDRNALEERSFEYIFNRKINRKYRRSTIHSRTR